MKEKLMEMVKELEKVDDVIVNEYNNEIHLDFNDFDGFDEDWEEIDRDYVNFDLVEKVQDFLKNNCLSCDNDYYTTYNFDTFNVVVGYTSYDI